MTDVKNLWGGRFVGKPDETFADFNRSFAFDQRLFAADARASAAHARALERAGVISARECDAIVAALDQLIQSSTEDKDFFASAAEDVHSFIEAKLIESLGDLGKKLHTGRSRNDQVATAFRLWLVGEIDLLAADVAALQSALVRSGDRFFDVAMPGYTHLQRAQPILWPHWCLAYFEMLRRDCERLAETRRRVNVLPLGSGALAGSGFGIDREAVARDLKFEAITRNSLDAVSDRDLAVEFTAAASLVMVHLSRLAEDLILYCTAEFGFVDLSDAVSTGSSLMPQKKNPDALELIRGKAGRVFGGHIGLLTTLKGLPLAYNKDLQEDKQAIFDAVDTVKMCLRVAAIVIDNAAVNRERTRRAAELGYMNATELADAFARAGIPFRDAHEAAGKVVLHAMSAGKALGELSLEEIRSFCPTAPGDTLAALSLERTLASRDVIGGTSPERVRSELDAARQALSVEKSDD